MLNPSHLPGTGRWTDILYFRVLGAALLWQAPSFIPHSTLKAWRLLLWERVIPSACVSISKYLEDSSSSCCKFRGQENIKPLVLSQLFFPSFQRKTTNCCREIGDYPDTSYGKKSVFHGKLRLISAGLMYKVGKQQKYWECQHCPCTSSLPSKFLWVSVSTDTPVHGSVSVLCTQSTSF